MEIWEKGKRGEMRRRIKMEGESKNRENDWEGKWKKVKGEGRKGREQE
jgi:hypothetical protein